MADEPQAKNVEKEMAEQLAGFRAVARFRRFCYQAVAVLAILVGAAEASQEGFKAGLFRGFLALLFGIAGARLLTTPVAAVLWYRKWRCPACSRRLGQRASETCPGCGARLFSPRPLS